MSLTFYTNPMSRGRIVRWMLEEVGAPYETEIVGYGGEMKGPAYQAINPMGKVPALRHDGVVVTETAAICAYLADAFPDRGLAPPLGDSARGPYFRWMFFGAGPFEAAITVERMGFVVPAEREVSTGWGKLATVLAALEAYLGENEYVAGGRFSAADVYVGSQIAFSLQFGTLEKRPAFVAYADRVWNRPAAVRAREIDDALIAAAAKG